MSSFPLSRMVSRGNHRSVFSAMPAPTDGVGATLEMAKPRTVGPYAVDASVHETDPCDDDAGRMLNSRMRSGRDEATAVSTDGWTVSLSRASYAAAALLTSAGRGYNA